MPRSTDTDIVIVGAGISGVSLAVHLHETGALAGRSLTILEPRTEPAFERSLCMFDVLAHPFRDAITHRWQHYAFATHTRSATRATNQYPYVHIPAVRFFDVATTKLMRASQEISRGVSVSDISDRGDHVQLQTSAGELRAQVVFDSRLPSEKNTTSHADITLLQHFRGFHIRTNRPVFTPDRATLMDFRVSQANGLHFMYVLPYAPDEALVESTFFTPRVVEDHVYEHAIHAYLDEHLNVQTWELVRDERGAIPMTTKPFDPRPSQRVHRIGIAGGAAKPSTGFAFLAIQRQAHMIANAIQHDLLASVAPLRSKLTLSLDAIFLQRLVDQPQSAPQLFVTLAERVSPDILSRFLFDAASATDTASVVRSLPATPMIRSALRSSRLWLRP